MAELWDVFDINRNKTGRLHERGKPMSAGDCHLIVQVWIMNSKGEFLISRRTGWYDGMWQTTGGCAITGDDGLSAAMRETKEELGIDLNPKNGQLFKQYSEPHTNDAGIALFDVWVFRQEVEISTVVFQPDETCDAMWANKEKIRQMIDEGVFLSEWYPYLDELFYIYEIPGYNSFTKIKPINKGWSGDKKYYIETADGQRMFLRVSGIEDQERKKVEYEMMERVYNLGALTPQPLGFGLCNDGKSIYSLSEWLDGEDAEKILPHMSETEQYVIGMKAGETLRMIHSLPVPDNVESWRARFESKVQSWIDKYKSKPQLHSEIGEMLICYLSNHRNVLDSRSQTFIHGDYNTENIIVKTNGEISVIDFNNYNTSYGDPWWDINNMAWMPAMFPHFYTGQVKGYFGGEPPTEFWNVITYYLAYDALAALTDPYGLNGIEDGAEIVNNVLKWTDNFKNPMPTWYLKDIHIQYIDGIPYKLKAPFDFSFINKYGKVFKIFDEQGSGNISFGVQDDDKRYFIKFAGAMPELYNNDPASAISRLKEAVTVYKYLEHPTLIKFINAEEIGGGYAAVFEWVDAIGIEPFNSPDHLKFMQMPIELKIQAFEDILAFHTHIAAKGYIAIDFYDGSILYDYDKNKVIICDIDFYQRSPYIGDMGQWGSSRFVSPEECTNGAVMDEITNVYTMGATAFSLFAYSDRSPEAWTLSKHLYDVAKKAVSDDRSQRQQSIEQFVEEWKAAKVA